MDRKHSVKSFDQDLGDLSNKLTEMFTLCNRQLDRAIQALHHGDMELAEQVIKDEPAANTLQQDVHRITVTLLAKRQPVAVDLRLVVAGLKIATDLERVSDYSVGIARHARELGTAPIKDLAERIIVMADKTKIQFAAAREAFADRNALKAIATFDMDDEVDDLYREILENLRHIMASNSQVVDEGSRLLFVARSLERTADHSVNVANHIHYLVTGRYINKAEGK